MDKDHSINNETKVGLDWEHLVLIAGGHSAFQLLWAGVELGLYDELSQKPDQDLSSLAQSLGLESYPARVRPFMKDSPTTSSRSRFFKRQ